MNLESRPGTALSVAGTPADSTSAAGIVAPNRQPTSTSEKENMSPSMLSRQFRAPQGPNVLRQGITPAPAPTRFPLRDISNRSFTSTPVSFDGQSPMIPLPPGGFELTPVQPSSQYEYMDDTIDRPWRPASGDPENRSGLHAQRQSSNKSNKSSIAPSPAAGAPDQRESGRLSGPSSNVFPTRLPFADAGPKSAFSRVGGLSVRVSEIGLRGASSVNVWASQPQRETQVEPDPFKFDSEIEDNVRANPRGGPQSCEQHTPRGDRADAGPSTRRALDPDNWRENVPSRVNQPRVTVPQNDTYSVQGRAKTGIPAASGEVHQPLSIGMFLLFCFRFKHAVLDELKSIFCL